MEKYVLKNMARAFLFLLLVFISCVSSKVRKAQLLQRTYSTTLPSGKVFSVTFRDADSTFEETNCAGHFRGMHLYEDYRGELKEYASDSRDLFILCHADYIDSLDENNYYSMTFKYIPTNHDGDNSVVMYLKVIL